MQTHPQVLADSHPRSADPLVIKLLFKYGSADTQTPAPPLLLVTFSSCWPVCCLQKGFKRAHVVMLFAIFRVC